MKTSFNPSNFNFKISTDDDRSIVYRTYPVDKYIIGSYEIRRFHNSNEWEILEIGRKNEKDFLMTLYIGEIPNDEWGFQLLKNMNLLLPVIKSELKIEEIFSELK